MALLDGSVVVVSGVGPGLGRSIALQCARAGADLVLAARTAERLDEVAKEVTALGSRAVAAPTDITDPDAAEALAGLAHAEFGRVDTVVHNAFAIPPLTSLAEADPDRLRAAFDTNVVAALQLTRLFTPALAASRGSVVMINSAVLRHSRVGYGGYKLAKAALLALAQNLATELGPQGIRVNSVAPGWIWGPSLQWYFRHLARQRGITADEVYQETAGTLDLRELPEPDAVADTVVFLASRLARAVTGQCLDVNAGEYHH